MSRRWVLAAALLTSCGHEPPPPPAPPPLPEPRSLDEACARWKCRPEGRVRLQTPKGTLVVTEGRTVYSDGKLVRILAGEQLAITGGVQGDALVNLRVVDSPGDRDVILLKFEQSQLKAGPAMTLKVENHFARTLKYRASMEVPERKGFGKTSSCPVVGGRASYEMWPHPIISLLLKELHFIDAGGGKVVCD
jgi:hypothetical protein